MLHYACLTAKPTPYSQPCRICPKQSASANLASRVVEYAQTDRTLAPVRRTARRVETREINHFRQLEPRTPLLSNATFLW